MLSRDARPCSVVDLVIIPACHDGVAVVFRYVVNIHVTLGRPFTTSLLYLRMFTMYSLLIPPDWFMAYFDRFL